MISSYRLSQEHNAQTVIWFVASRSWRLLRWAAWGAWLALGMLTTTRCDLADIDRRWQL